MLFRSHPAAKPLALFQLFGTGAPTISPAEERRANPWITAFGLDAGSQARGELANAAVYAFDFAGLEGLAEFRWMGESLLESGDAEMLRFLRELGPDRGPVRAGFCWIESEQIPNPESRVSLGRELDALGQRRVVVDWRLGERDWRSLTRTGRLLAEALGRAGTGRMKLWPWLLEGAPDGWRRLFPEIGRAHV